MAISIYNPIGGSGNRNGGKGLPGQYGDYNKVQSIAKKNEIIAPVKKNIQPVTPEPETRYVYVNNSTPAPSYSGGADFGDIVDVFKSLIEQQRAAAEAAYNAQYEQQKAQNKQAFESNRNQINSNFMRGKRYLQSLHGDAISGIGLSNKARNYQNYQSNLASNLQNYTNNDANALAQFNQNKAGAYSAMANAYINNVLPAMLTIDDRKYRWANYLQSL